MKHPISYEEAEAFAEQYGSAPTDVFEAQYERLCEFMGSDRLADVAAKAESSHRIRVAMTERARRLNAPNN